MKMNRITSLFLSICIVVSIAFVPTTVSASRVNQVSNSSDYSNPYVTDTITAVAKSDTVLNYSITDLTSGFDTDIQQTIYYLSTPKDFAILSHLSRSETFSGYYFKIMMPTISLSPSFTDEDSGDTYTFIGIGDTEHPFKGTIFFPYGNVEPAITLGKDCSPLFNCIASSASVSQIIIIADDSTGGFAQTLKVDSNVCDFSHIQVTGSIINNYINQDAGLLFGNVIADTETNVTLSMTAPTLADPTVIGPSIIFSNSSTNKISTCDGSAGCLIGSINGVSLTLTGDTDLNVKDCQIKAIAGNAGALVGAITNGGSFTVGNTSVSGSSDYLDLVSNPNAKQRNTSVTAIRYFAGGTDKGGNAGGIIGYIESGSTFASGNCKIGVLSTDQTADGTLVSITSGCVELYSGNSTGGFIGAADSSTINIGSLTVSDITVTGGVYCGGGIGNSRNSTVSFGSSLTSNAVITVTSDTRFGLAGAGGVFGQLLINSDLSLKVDNTITQITNETTDNGTAPLENICVGGAIGIYGADNISRSLTVSGFVSSAYTDTQGLLAYGGVVGMINTNSYCLINVVSEKTGTVTAGTADAETLNVRHFGGAAALVDDGAFLDINSITVSGGFCVSKISGKNNDGCAGGLVGYIGKASALRLAGNIVLSDFAYGSTINTFVAYTGQLVGCQESSLIYTDDGFNLTRNKDTNNPYGMDDIGNYGSVIRNDIVEAIKTVNHVVTLNKIETANATSVTVNNLSEYASLAITLNSRGYFSGITGVNTSGYSSLLSSTITIGNDIDLTDSGITTLTRSNDTYIAFTGTLDGGNHTVTLCIGKKYTTGGTHGNGEIYGAVRVGIFATIKEATIKNITVNGLINYGSFANSSALNNDKLSYVGGIAGCATGNTNFSNVTSNVVINTKNTRMSNGDYTNSCFGGILGFYSGNSVSFKNCNGNAQINVRNSYTGNTYYAGGVVAHINADSKANIEFKNTTLSGLIQLPGTDTVPKYARIGGLATYIETSSDLSPENAAIVTIDGISVNNPTDDIAISSRASNSSGGLFGYYWNNVNSTLTNSSSTNNIAGSLSISEGASFGGLVYQIDGRFDVEKTTLTGIFTDSKKKNNASDGLFVYEGTNLYMIVRKDTVTVNAVKNCLKPCDDLVGINIVSDTNKGLEAGGIVSIETSKTSETGEKIKTIGAYSDPWQLSDENTNKYTRYYYNVEGLDRDHGETYLNSVVTNKEISGFNALLLWHILNYTSNINKSVLKKSTAMPAYYFGADNFSCSDDYTLTEDISMSDGFCLYPTTVAGGSFDFDNHNITFDNAVLTKAAKTSVQPSQHYMMQTGLFNNINGGFTVSNAKLSGNVGIHEGGSGALVTGRISGSHDNTTYYEVPFVINKLVLNNITVNGSNSRKNKYAPLLINTIKTCASADISNVTQSGYNANQKAGSSLIGTVGFVNENNESATHIKLKFDKIILADSDSDSIFYRASFLDSYSYQSDGTSNGYYNFNHIEDWNSTHVHNVTYGEELTTKKTEYLDNDDLVNPDSATDKLADPYDFSGYMPYIYVAANTDNSTYSIDINLKTADLDKGCGTYEDPYIITTASQFLSVYNYINDVTPNKNWAVNYPNDSFCEKISENKWDHTTYKYDPDNSKTFTDKISKHWLAKAYYVIESDIDLSAQDSFAGLGTDDIPFSGIIIGKGNNNNNHTVIMPSGNLPNVAALGLVKVGNGCVIKDLNVEYGGTYNISKTVGSNFGGVISQVVGGDNVIDSVSVTLTDSASITLQHYLTYIGGYVGLDKAGGVIFRNMNGKKGLTFKTPGLSPENYLYCNPYIGRVLDGYAVAESGTPIDNGDKNYKIPTLSAKGTRGVSINYINKGTDNRYNSDIIVNSSEGLYILSAALNCGALSTGEVKAYNGSGYVGETTPGSDSQYKTQSNGSNAHVRNALYNNVGNVLDSTDSDYIEAMKDDLQIYPKTTDSSSDTTTPLSSNCVPYLVKNYMDTSHSVAPERVAGGYHNNTLYFNADCDMTDYASGFRGIGGRYSTNAAKQISDNQTNYDRNSIVGYNTYGKVKSSDSAHTVTLAMKYSQYKDANDLQVKEVGLIRSCSVNRLTQKYTDLIISGSITQNTYSFNASTGLSYYFETNDSTRKNLTYSCGGLLGNIVNSDYDNKNTGVQKFSAAFENISAKDLSVTSTGFAGSLVGYVGASLPVSFKNCSYNNIKVSGYFAAGGLIGKIDTTTNNKYATEIKITDDTTFDKAAITALSPKCHIAGIVGQTSGMFKLNSEATKTLTLNDISTVFSEGNNPTTSNSSVTAAAGGVAGYCSNSSNIGKVTIQNSHIFGTEYSFDSVKNSTVDSAVGYAGGIIGTAAYSTSNHIINGCQVSNTQISSCNVSGGIIGITAGTGTEKLQLINCSVKNSTDIAAKFYSGGMVGYSTYPLYIKGMSVADSSITSGGGSENNSRAAGIVSASDAKLTLEASVVNGTKVQNNVSNCHITSFYTAGAISKPAGNYFILNDLSIIRCNIISSGNNSGTVAGVINTDNSDTAATQVYLNNTTVTDNALVSYNFSPTSGGGGIQNNVYGYLYANSVLNVRNKIGTYTGSKSIFSISGVDVTEITDNSVIGNIVSNVREKGQAIINGYHGDKLSSNDVSKNSTGKFVVVYADFEGVSGSQNTTASLGEQITVSPSRDWSDNTWYGDGIAESLTDKESIARKILSDKSIYKSYGTISTLDYSDEDTTNLVKMSKYYSNNQNAGNLPLLYVKGTVNTLLTDYLNVLTNGGYSSLLALDSSAISLVSSRSYSIDSNGIKPATDADGNNSPGSLNFNNGVFSSAQNYDNISSDIGGTFTVLRLKFSNPNTNAPDDGSAQSFADFTLDLSVYYPQILKVDRNVRLLDTESYSISKFVSSISQKDNQQKLNTFYGGTFSAYFEYVYNELRLQDDWNYPKTIEIRKSNGDKLALPAGSELTLIDLNSSTIDEEQSNSENTYYKSSSGGYRSYYYTTTSPSSEIPFTNFKRVDDETNFTVTALNQLPVYNNDGIYKKSNTDPKGYGIERYIILINLPSTSMELYYISAGLDKSFGNNKHVELDPLSSNDPYEYITVWPEPTTTGEFSSPNGNTTISLSNNVNVNLNLQTKFHSDYLQSGSKQYSFIHYYLTNNDGQRVNFPAGTVMTIDGTAIPFGTNTSEYLLPIVPDNPNDPNDPQNIASGNTISQNIKLDFSAISAPQFNADFPDDSYNLCADYFITSDIKKPASGIKVTKSIGLTTAKSIGASIVVTVADDSQLNLGVNPIDIADETNNGIINYNVSLNLSECSQEDIEKIKNGNVALEFALYKKNSDNIYPQSSVNSSDYLSNYQTTINLSKDEIKELCENTYKQISKSFTISVKIPTSSLEDFANYKYEVSARFTGEYNYTVKDHFIYTLAKIRTEFID